MKNCASDVHGEVLCVEFLGVMKTVITSSKVKSLLVSQYTLSITKFPLLRTPEMCPLLFCP